MFEKNLLKSELVLQNISLSMLADKLAISKGTISKKMSCKSKWTLAEIRKIKELIGLEKATQIFLL